MSHFGVHLQFLYNVDRVKIGGNIAYCGTALRPGYTPLRLMKQHHG